MKGLLLFLAIFFAVGFLIFTFVSCLECQATAVDNELVGFCLVIAAISLTLSLIFLVIRRAVENRDLMIDMLRGRMLDWKGRAGVAETKRDAIEKERDRYKLDFEDLARSSGDAL